MVYHTALGMMTVTEKPELELVMDHGSHGKVELLLELTEFLSVPEAMIQVETMADKEVFVSAAGSCFIIEQGHIVSITSQWEWKVLPQGLLRAIWHTTRSYGCDIHTIWRGHVLRIICTKLTAIRPDLWESLAKMIDHYSN